MFGFTALRRVVPRPGELVELQAVVVHECLTEQAPLPLHLFRELSVPTLGYLVQEQRKWFALLILRLTCSLHIAGKPLDILQHIARSVAPSFELDNLCQWCVRPYLHDVTPFAFSIARAQLPDVTVLRFTDLSVVSRRVFPCIIVLIAINNFYFSWCFGCDVSETRGVRCCVTMCESAKLKLSFRSREDSTFRLRRL